ncbi:tRNA modification GTPase MnmE [Anaerohalosphaera lusitana]|uniref:tRNA modification GTPase MnmE n=1 Tax=Anaerohalosphaera lusitana TaxID=1936003 RepID=A0A1U9NGX5_9BACT|nr:GTPase [Anaerohalosphaera lusitana]AQT67179.1 tRNA modification GTPase MnmE [Anaerohalosphaera lusitana]
MYELSETICAVSSADVGAGEVCKSILRISGGDAREVVGAVVDLKRELEGRGIYRGVIGVGEFLRVDAEVYFFAGPASYTGEDLAEVHFFAAGAVVEAVFGRMLERCRMAGPGEFTLRAYLNGKIDLSQAEAVAEIVAGGNLAQVDAAQRLLAGKLCDTVGGLREEILDVLSLLEAGMDFSEEDIEFISADDAGGRIGKVRDELEGILGKAIRYEEAISLPSVGLVGRPNAGKSSLLNRLVGSERSIISEQEGTTRDVLTGVVEFGGMRCVVFDCAGIEEVKAGNVIDEWAQEAAVEAIRGAELLAVCVDMGRADYAEAVEVPGVGVAKRRIVVGTKMDAVSEGEREERLGRLREVCGCAVVGCSSVSGEGMEDVLKAVRGELLAEGGAGREDMVSINERHRQTVEKAVKALGDAADEIGSGNEEICAMLLRDAYEVLGGIEREDVDEGVLDRIFGRFCIGK